MTDTQTQFPQQPVSQSSTVPQQQPAVPSVTPAPTVSQPPVVPPISPTSSSVATVNKGSPFDPKILFIIFTLFVFVMVGLLLVQVSKKKTPTQKTLVQAETSSESSVEAPTPSPIPLEMKGSFALATTQPGAFTANQPATFIVTATTDNADIVAYDVILSYDPEAFEFIDAKSLVPEFIVKTYDRKTHIAITGVKTAQDQSGTILTDVQLVEITVKPLKTGSLAVSLQGTEKEKTKFVDSKTQLYAPQTEEVKVEVN